jgi:mRNA-degrading endonuclease YafQ of YafQ-DinJ toxin-antitoxin module
MATGKRKDIFTLVWTDTFSRTTRKYLRRHPELCDLFKDTLQLLETNPHASQLRLHPLKGRHQGKHSVRINYEYRIILILKIIDKEVILLDIGSHDEVYCN